MADKRIRCTAAVVLLYGAVASVSGLQNIVAMKEGSNVKMFCGQPGIDKVEWLFRNESARDERTLKMDHSNRSSLLLNRTQLNDAGTYACNMFKRKNGTLTESKLYAQLIILEANPICDTNMIRVSEKLTIPENKVIRMRCSVTYGGNWMPSMDWTATDVDNTHVIVNTTPLVVSEGHTLISTLEIVGNVSTHGLRFSCRTYFGKIPNAVLANSSISPNFSFIWTTEINILYGPRNISIVPLREYYQPNEELICTTDSNPVSSFMWKNLKTGRISQGSTLIITESMAQESAHSYECIATYVVKDFNISSTLSGIIVFAVTKQKSQLFSLYLPLLCLIPVVLAVIWSVCAIVAWRRKRTGISSGARRSEGDPSKESVSGMNDYLELTKTTRVQAPDYEEMSFTAAPPSDTTPQQ